MQRVTARRFLPLAGLILFVALWSAGVARARTHIVPGPWQTASALVALARSGALLHHVTASLFRVTWGFLSAALLAIPLGLCLGFYRRGEQALNPLLQILRPISPLAWIPIAILWFGVGDGAAVFIIFIASFLPLCAAATSAVARIHAVHLQAGRNFCLSPVQLLQQVMLPAVAPQLLVGVRLALGIAWLVVVAAEMIAVNSGLGFLIIDSRNAGNRYDQVVAGMVTIGIIGLALDVLVRRLERLRPLEWGYAGTGVA